MNPIVPWTNEKGEVDGVGRVAIGCLVLVVVAILTLFDVWRWL